MAVTLMGANGTVFVSSDPATLNAVNAIFSSAATQYSSSGGVFSGQFVANNPGSATYFAQSAANVTGVLSGKQATFEDTFASSTVYGGDNTNSTIVSYATTGTLTAFLGAGASTVNGFGANDAISTDAGSAATLNFSISSRASSQTNVVNTAGQDTISVSAPLAGQTQSNLVSVTGAGASSVSLKSGAGLAFFNASSGTSSIASTDGSSVSISGAGSTSVTAGSGTETFSLDTAAGNVTLVGGTAANTLDTFGFEHPAAGVTDGGSATATINDFMPADMITLTGYGTTPAAAYTVAGGSGGTTLSLSDGTRINFTNVTDPNAVVNTITLK